MLSPPCFIVNNRYSNGTYTNKRNNMILNIGYFAGIPALYVATIFMLVYLGVVT